MFTSWGNATVVNNCCATKMPSPSAMRDPNSPTRPPTVEGLSCFFMVIVVVVLAARLYTRFRVTKNFGLDDVFAIIGTVRTYM